jgi:hypothetical protein
MKISWLIIFWGNAVFILKTNQYSQMLFAIREITLLNTEKGLYIKEFDKAHLDVFLCYPKDYDVFS